MGKWSWVEQSMFPRITRKILEKHTGTEIEFLAIKKIPKIWQYQEKTLRKKNTQRLHVMSLQVQINTIFFFRYSSNFTHIVTTTHPKSCRTDLAGVQTRCLSPVGP